MLYIVKQFGVVSPTMCVVEEANPEDAMRKFLMSMYGKVPSFSMAYNSKRYTIDDEDTLWVFNVAPHSTQFERKYYMYAAYPSGTNGVWIVDP